VILLKNPSFDLAAIESLFIDREFSSGSDATAAK
jgi:hypothetical protein